MDSTRSFLNRMNKPPSRYAVKFYVTSADKRVEYVVFENGQRVRRSPKRSTP